MLDIVKNLVRGKKIVLVAFDAGGANQIFSLFKRIDTYASIRVLCDGPAKKIYEEIYKSNYGEVVNLADSLTQTDMVFTGTGLGSNLEYDAISNAKKNGKFVVALLDHWVNYRERFTRFGVEVLPDEVWVVDNYARGIAEEIFREIRIRLVPDSYAENIMEQVKSAKTNIKNQALFLLEPLHYNGAVTSFLNPLEAAYFENFLKRWQFLAEKQGMTLKLRLHPTESMQKYMKYASESGVVLSDSNELSNDMAESNLVFGYHSYALTIAARLGKRVFCALPVGVKCKLPHRTIPRFFL